MIALSLLGLSGLCPEWPDKPPARESAVHMASHGARWAITATTLCQNPAEKMPEEFYGLRPGTQEEVRTFGQQVGHVANFNFLLPQCSQAKGEKNPNAGNNLEKT